MLIINNINNDNDYGDYDDNDDDDGDDDDDDGDDDDGDDVDESNNYNESSTVHQTYFSPSALCLFMHFSKSNTACCAGWSQTECPSVWWNWSIQ